MTLFFFGRRTKNERGNDDFIKWWCFHLDPFFYQKKMSFGDFLMTTWERENESEEKKEPEIPRLSHAKKCTYLLPT